MSTGLDAVGIAAAIGRGVAFLAARQLPSGELPVLASGKPDPSVFPTALAAYSLSFAPEAAAVCARALDFLVAEMDPRALWRHWPRTHPHHHQLPPDTDDTACASLALARAGRPFPDNRARLLANRNRQGLFRTWIFTTAQWRHPLVTWRFFRRTSARPSDADAVVNANALFYLGMRDETIVPATYLIDVVLRGREAACDKWYDNPFAVWYFLARALGRLGAGELISTKIEAATPATALDAALAACALASCGRPADVTPLLAQQLPSGGWPAAALYHGGRLRRADGSYAEPHPDAPRWGSEELTTAFAIEALARHRGQGSEAR
jgi:hypothetical protein